jgi:methyl-accepting chemotaxis protein
MCLFIGVSLGVYVSLINQSTYLNTKSATLLSLGNEMLNDNDYLIKLMNRFVMYFDEALLEDYFEILNAGNLDANLEEMKAIGNLTAVEMRHIDNMRSYLDRLEAIEDNALNAYDEGHLENARAFILSREYQDADYNLAQSTKMLIGSIAERYTIEIESVHYRMQGILVLIVVVLLISIVILFALVLQLKNRTLKPLYELADISSKLARGNFQVRMPESTNDEIGLLSKNFKSMADTVKTLIFEVEDVAQKHEKEGQLNLRMSAEKYEGIYSEMAKMINDLFDSQNSVKNDAFGSILKIANGDFDTPLRQFPGLEGNINETVENLREKIRGVANEISNLASHAKNGDTDARIDTKKYHGDWVGLMTELNNLIAAVADKANWYESLLDSIPLPLSVTDNDMNWTFINKATENFLGKARKEVMGKHCSNWGANICNTSNCGIANYRRGITQTHFVQSGMHCQVDVSALKDTRGNAIGYIEVVQDVTPMKSMIDKSNSLMEKIKSVSEQLNIGSRQISDNSQDLASGAQLQAIHIEKLNASVEIINEKTQTTSQNISNANKLSENARNNANLGNQEMKQMVSAMQGIKDASDSISRIIKTIEDIAFQTNLLALNAAVEAARAGEHGKGFAVVAEEVRSLAERSQLSAKETTKLISDSGSRVEKGTEIALKTAHTLESIVSDFDSVSNLISEIAGAASEQAESLSQISTGLMEISGITEQNSAASEESASASMELLSQADALTDLFKG